MSLEVPNVLLPTNVDVLGFTNEWFGHAVADPLLMTLSTGIEIRVIQRPVFLATKFAALDSPSREGHGDLRASHDLEDIVTLIDGCPHLGGEVRSGDPTVRGYLQEQFGKLLLNPNLAELIEGHLELDSANRARLPEVLAVMEMLAAP